MSARTLVAVLVVGALATVGCSSVETTTGPDEVASITDPSGYATQPAPIELDGDSDDWDSLSVRHMDAGDGEGLTIERLWTAHTDGYVFFRIELGQEINLQEGNNLTLYLDTDDDPRTGTAALGLGAELSWTFGRREGRFEGEDVGHADIGFSSLPTVQSDVFEVALNRSAEPDGGTPLFQSDSIRIALSSDGDRLPDEDGGVGYVLSESASPVDSPTLARPDTTGLRILSQNAVNDFEENRSALFKADRQPSYRRILKATSPDVIAFQEIYDQTPREVEDVVDRMVENGGEWAWEKRGQDLVVGSRYPILGAHTIPGYEDYESGAFLLETDAALGDRLLLIVMHPPCCNYDADEDDPSRNAQRQHVVDGVAAFLRDVQRGDGPFGIEEQVPVAVVGDMNFVGDAQQPRTLRTGDIVNNDTFGPSKAPDWDGTALLDTNPPQTGVPLHTTWIDAESSFPPGRLDYAFVSDSILDVVHEFVLRTSSLSEKQLQQYDLRRDDTATASDHLPVVIDVAAE